VRLGDRVILSWNRSGTLEDAWTFLAAIGEGTALRNVIRPRG